MALGKSLVCHIGTPSIDFNAFHMTSTLRNHRPCPPPLSQFTLNFSPVELGTRAHQGQVHQGQIVGVDVQSLQQSSEWVTSVTTV